MTIREMLKDLNIEFPALVNTSSLYVLLEEIAKKYKNKNVDKGVFSECKNNKGCCALCEFEDECETRCDKCGNIYCDDCPRNKF